MKISYDKDLFTRVDAEIYGNPNLREPQIDGYFGVYEHFIVKKKKTDAVVVLPTGVGKTGLMAILPYGISNGRVLIIAPQIVIKDTVIKALDPSSADNFWTKRKVINLYKDLPAVIEFEGKDTKLDILESANIVVCNVQKLQERLDSSPLNYLPKNFFDIIIIDEAHHSTATTWVQTLKHFDKAKVVKVTGTPIRTDGIQIAGELAYAYKLSSAMANGMVKSLENFKYIPDELHLTIDGDLSKVYTVNEILDLELKDDEWISRTVAYTKECSEKVVDLSLKYLNAKCEKSKQPHKIIAVACSIEHAKQIKDIYESKGYRVSLVHSDMKKEELEQAYSDIDNHRVDVVVNVSKLGEGYDHSYLSIAAIFRPFRHQLPYAQFIGRILRIIPDAELALDNVGQIVSHKFLTLDKLWEFYKQQMEESELIKELKEIDVLPDIKDYIKDPERSKDISYGIAKEYGIGKVIVDQYMTTDILKRRKEEEAAREKKIAELQKLLNIDREKAKIFIDTAESDDEHAKRPDKYYANKKNSFDTYIKHEIVPYLINEFKIDKEDTNLKDCQLFAGKYRWIAEKIKNNGGYLAVYFTQFTNSIIGKVRGDWKVEEFDRAKEKLDDQVKYVKSIISVYLGQ